MNSEPFMMNSISRSSSFSEKSLENLSGDIEPVSGSIDTNKTHCLGTLVRSVLSGKKQDEIPSIVESMLSKVTEELELRLASEGELLRTTSTRSSLSDLNQSPTGPSLQEMQPSYCDEVAEVYDKNGAPTSSCDEMTETDDKNDALRA